MMQTVELLVSTHQFAVDFNADKRRLVISVNAFVAVGEAEARFGHQFFDFVGVVGFIR